MRVIIHFKNGDKTQLDFVSEIIKGDMGRIHFSRRGLQSATWVYYMDMIDKIEIDSIG